MAKPPSFDDWGLEDCENVWKTHEVDLFESRWECSRRLIGERSGALEGHAALEGTLTDEDLAQARRLFDSETDRAAAEKLHNDDKRWHLANIEILLKNRGDAAGKTSDAKHQESLMKSAKTGAEGTRD